MWVFTEIADWFEKQRTQSDAIVDDWVESSNYSQGAMIVGASVKALTTFGAGFVDILRLGDGVKSGTAAGVGTDALRFVAVFPVGKAAQVLKSAKGTAAAKLVVDTGGPNCFWVASAKAFGQISHKYKGKLLASVEEIARALGMNMDNLWRIPNLAQGMTYLQRLGAKVGPVKSVVGVREVERMIPRDGSVVIVAVRVMRNEQQVAGHAIYAYKDALGRLRFMDRTVGSVSPTVYRSIDEIAPMYGATELVAYQAAILHNVFVKSILHDAPRLLIPVLGVIATEDSR